MVTYFHPEWGALRPIRGVLCDMDGLVLDSERLYTRFWMEAARSLGFPMTLEEALGMRSLGAGPGQEKLWSYFGPEADYHTIRNRRIELMEAYLETHDIPAKKGIGELLDALDARGIPAAITSASPVEKIEQYLKALGLYHRFRAICSARQVAHGKPEPDIYLWGAECIGVTPEHCLALEDSPTGIEAAWRAGCLPVLIPDQDDPAEAIGHMLYARAGDLEQVISLLEGRT